MNLIWYILLTHVIISFLYFAIGLIFHWQNGQAKKVFSNAFENKDRPPLIVFYLALLFGVMVSLMAVIIKFEAEVYIYKKIYE